MKRIISLIICVIMIVPCFTSGALASDGKKMDENIAGIGSVYATSQWNNDSNPRWMADGNLKSSWQFWRPSSCEKDPQVDDNNQHFGLKFSEYYEFNEIKLYARQIEAGNNTKFVFKALVMGEWKELGVLYNSDMTDTYKDDAGATCGAIVLKLPEYITTKNIRIYISGYGVSEGGSGKWWEVPIIQEIEVNGKKGKSPEFDVPEGALLSDNAVLGGMSSSSSSLTPTYPAKASDSINSNSYWQAGGNGDGEWWMSEFDKAYKIDKVSINFGGSIDGISFTYSIFVLGTDNKWKEVASDKRAIATAKVSDNIVFPINAEEIKAVKVICTDVDVTDAAKDKAKALITEVEAHIANGDKCIFLNEYMSVYRKQSTAAGNIACYGVPYASSTITYSGVSYVEYLNDGETENSSPAWFANTRAAGEYCGVTLKEKHNVSKVVLYFNDGITGDINGHHVLSFDVQAKVGENYVTVGKGTSYDCDTGKYISSVELDEAVKTDDIRIVFTSNGLIFPYLKELEVYEEGFIYTGYIGYSTLRTQGGAAKTNTFAPKTVVVRAKILDIKSPISTVYTVMNMQRNAALTLYAHIAQK